MNRTAGPLLDLAAVRGVAALNAAPYGSGILVKGPDAYAHYEYREAQQETVELAAHHVPDELWSTLELRAPKGA